MALRDVFARIGQAFRNGADAGARRRASLRPAPAPAPARAPAPTLPNPARSEMGARLLALLSDMTSQMKDMPAIGRWAAVSDAVRLAYPDRGIEVLKDAASWLDFPSLNRQAQVCSLCQRSLAGLRQDGLIICPVCARIRNERDLPTEATFAEIIRALEAYGGEEKEALVAEVERQWRTNRLRVVDSAQCAACRDSGSAVSGRATLCFGCLAAGRIPTGSAQAP